MRTFARVGAVFAASLAGMALAFWAGHTTAEALLATGWPAGGLTGLVNVVAGPEPDSPQTQAQPPAVAEPGTAEDQAQPDADGGTLGQPADFQVFWDALEIVRSEDVGESPGPEEVTYGAIRGSLQALDDPFTAFTDPVDTEVASPELEREFEGIGAYVTTAPDGRLMIETPMRGMSAERAGVMAGDIVIEVDGAAIVGMDISEAVLLIRGPKGTTVRLTIVREGVEDPFVIPVVRERIEIPSVDGVSVLSERGAPEVGYMQVSAFATETRDEVVAAIDKLSEDGATALILDLRNNPGGYLNSALEVASEFIGDGVIVYQQDNRGRRTAMTARSGGHATDIPLVVLVNRGSASASEIVAGAIRDRGRGVLVGQTTFGKGSVQNVHMLSDGSELRVTVAVWLTPNGTLIHEEGIAPDVPVEPGQVAATQASEESASATPDIVTALASPTDGSPSPSPAPSEQIQEDPQLDRAVQEALRLLEDDQ